MAGTGGRWDIIGFDPHLWLDGYAGHCLLRANGEEQCLPFDPAHWPELLRQQLPQAAPVPDLPAECPFHSGLIGAWSYELGRLHQGLALRSPAPLLHAGLYRRALITDHASERCWLLAPATESAALVAELSRADAPSMGFELQGVFNPHLSETDHRIACERIAAYLLDGDCYQVNLAIRHATSWRGDGLAAYLHLRRVTPVPHAVYLACGHRRALLSLSPERFVRVSRNGAVQSEPIKGTRPRAHGAADLELREQLRDSAKDRAEHLMILDLIRNDLAQCCTDVAVARRFDVRSFANVHHLVSTVTGQLRPGLDALDMLHAALPGGSITGAPKLRAMQIIDELEQQPRDFYCGALGYLSACGNFDSNIAIRTLVISDDSICCWGGGGIVADSTAALEYREISDKIAPLMRALSELRISAATQPSNASRKAW